MIFDRQLQILVPEKQFVHYNIYKNNFEMFFTFSNFLGDRPWLMGPNCRGPFELTLPNERYATGNERPNAFYVNYAITQNQFHEVFVISRTKKAVKTI
jgi:hypothetical protein